MFQPLHDYVLVKPVERVISSVLEVVSHERTNLGEVIAIGSGKVNKRGFKRPLDIKVGQMVRIGEFAFPEVRFHDVKYLVVQEADIAGIVEDKTIEENFI